MKILSTFMRQCVLAFALILVPSAVLVPALASAATTVPASAAISSASLAAATTGYPYVTGTASNVATIRLSITKTNDLWTIYKTSPVAVSNGAWQVSVPVKLAAGKYTVRIYNVSTNTVITSGTMTVSAGTVNTTAPVSFVPGCAPGNAFSTTTGQSCTLSAASSVAGCAPGNAFSTTTGQACTLPTKTSTMVVSATPILTVSTTNTATTTVTTTQVTNPNTVVTISGPTTLRVTSVPLLAGGTTGPNTTVPVSYLEVVNQGTATTTIKGFWVEEDGTTPVNSIIGFSTVDDKGNYRNSVGGYEGITPFANGKGYAPSGAVIAPQQMKLFTIKAQLSKYAAIGTSMKLNVVGVDSPQALFNSTFPILGTTWVIGG